MKKIIILILTFLLVFSLFSCSNIKSFEKKDKTSYASKTDIFKSGKATKEQFKKEYEKLLKDGEYQKLYDLLVLWNKQYPDDPELYIAFFNLYSNLSIDSGLVIRTDKSYESSTDFVAKDPDTNEIVGYLTHQTTFNKEYALKALYYINRGLKKYPDRLDMHFGKIHYLMMMKDYKSSKKHIIKLLDLCPQINNKWFWKNYEPIKDEDGNHIIWDVIQGHIYTMFQDYFKNHDNSILDYIFEISKKEIEIFPEYGPEPYNNIGIIYYFNDDYQNALKWFLKAFNFNEKDTIVINNIAYMYEKLNDYENAIKYYDLFLQYADNDSDIKAINKKIEKLKEELKNKQEN